MVMMSVVAHLGRPRLFWSGTLRLHVGTSGPLKSCRRYLGKWSPLATTFNTQQKEKLNFNLLKDNTGLLCIPQLKEWSGFYLLQENVELSVDSLVKEATSPDRQRKMVTIFDELSDTICKVADMADFMKFAHPETSYQKAAEDCWVKLFDVIERLNTNVELFRALKTSQDDGDVVPVDDVDHRVGDLFLFDFIQSGIHLNETQREKVVHLNNAIVQLGHFFVQGSHRPVNVPADKIPSNLLAWLSHCREGDDIVLRGYLSDHPNETVREATYKIYLNPDHHQEEILSRLLSARNEVANLVGYRTHADRTLKASLAETPENVMNYLELLAERIRGRVGKDTDILRKLKESSSYTCNKDLMPWDYPYFTSMARNKMFQIDTLEYAKYLSLGACMDGLNTICQSLFNVSLKTVDADHGELWNYDVHKLAVVHETEGTLGYIYCDFFQRCGKPEQDCHFTIRGGRQLDDGTYQLPVVVLMLNLRSPCGPIPSLLTPGQMENLFHEFGHAMHSMLGRARYQHITGTRCHTDFAEVPSTLMEFFARDPRVLSTFARHYKTGETIPDQMIYQLCQSKKLFAASETQTTVFYSILDQVYHGRHPLKGSPADILKNVQNIYHNTAHVPNTAWHLRFSHLVHYGAKYYAYSLAKGVASRIWHQCFKADPLNRSMGEKYRHEVLAHGGGKAPRDLIKAMLNEEPTQEKLVESLLEELDDTPNSSFVTGR